MSQLLLLFKLPLYPIVSTLSICLKHILIFMHNLIHKTSLTQMILQQHLSSMILQFSSWTQWNLQTSSQIRYTRTLSQILLTNKLKDLQKFFHMINCVNHHLKERNTKSKTILPVLLILLYIQQPYLQNLHPYPKRLSFDSNTITLSFHF